MDNNLLRKHWNGIFNELKERWPDLAQSDIDYINGDKARLCEVVEKRRHISKEEAAEDVQQFLSTLNLRRRSA